MKNLIAILFGMVIVSVGISSPVAQEITVRNDQGLFEAASGNATSGMNSGETIEIISTRFMAGKINVTTHKEQQAIFTFKKVLKAEDRNMAEDFAEVIEISIQRSGNDLKLYMKSPNPAPWSETNYSGRVEGDLVIPEGSGVEFDAVYFDVEMDGVFNSVRNRSSFGEISVKGVEEELEISSSNRNIFVSDIKGEISISGSYADVIIRDMQGGESPAYIRNENGSIVIEKFIGAFDVRNDFGRIKIDDAVLASDRSSVRGNYSPISINIEAIDDAGLTVRNNNEDIEIEIPRESPVDYSLRVDGNGEINAEGMTIVPTYVDYNRLDFKTGSGENRVRVSVGGKGNINILGL